MIILCYKIRLVSCTTNTILLIRNLVLMMRTMRMLVRFGQLKCTLYNCINTIVKFKTNGSLRTSSYMHVCVCVWGGMVWLCHFVLFIHKLDLQFI